MSERFWRMTTSLDILPLRELRRDMNAAMADAPAHTLRVLDTEMLKRLKGQVERALKPPMTLDQQVSHHWQVGNITVAFKPGDVNCWTFTMPLLNTAGNLALVMAPATFNVHELEYHGTDVKEAVGALICWYRKHQGEFA